MNCYLFTLLEFFRKVLVEKGRHALEQNTEKIALNNGQAKLLLEKFGIAMPPEQFVSGPEDVAAAADDIGYPVVLKGIGAKLMHKTDRGLVHLNLIDSGAVENAA